MNQLEGWIKCKGVESKQTWIKMYGRTVLWETDRPAFPRPFQGSGQAASHRHHSESFMTPDSQEVNAPSVRITSNPNPPTRENPS